MHLRRIAVCVLGTMFPILTLALQAQTAPPPTAYSLTESNSMLGPAMVTKIYRSGTKAVIDSQVLPTAENPTGLHARTWYDLKTQQTISWDVANTSSPCSQGSFSGDWGDPFAASTELTADLETHNAKQIGTETLHGREAKIFEATSAEGPAKVWVDEKLNLVLKYQFFPTGGTPQTVLEVTELNLLPPPVQELVIPARCSAAASAPPIPSDSEKIAAETSGDPQNFARAIYPPSPPSAASCTVLLRAVGAGSMEPISTASKVTLDLSVDFSRPTNAAASTSHDVTSELRDGVLRIVDAPAHFSVVTDFGDAGSSAALIYRQCFGAQTVLLQVLKNPAKLSDGVDWLWVKSGQYAAAPK